jgi:hypothetical protein
MKTDQVTDNFEKRFQLLDLLGDCEASQDQWTTQCEQLLQDIKQLNGPCYALLVRLKAAELKQAVYLCTLFQQYKVNEGMS